MNDCYAELNQLRTKYGTSIFDGSVRRLMRERVNAGREPRKKFSPKLYQKLFDKQKGQCPWCGLVLTIPARMNEIDHIDPNREDFNTEANLQLLHKDCNREKGPASIQDQAKSTGRSFTELIRTPIEDEQ